MTTRSKIWIFVATFAVGVAIYYPFSPAGVQVRNMRSSGEHIRSIKEQIESDMRFKNIRLGVTTAHLGSITVLGTVSSEADMEDLKSICLKNSPAVKITFSVIVNNPSSTQP